MAKGFHVLQHVASVDRTLEWYKGLGFKGRTRSMGPMSWGEVDFHPDGGLVIFPMEHPDYPAENLSWLQGPLGHGLILTVGVTDAERVWTKAQASGAKVDEPLQPNPWGGFSCQLEDPDGYIVSFIDRYPGEPKGGARRKAPAKKGAPKRAVLKKAAAKKGAPRKAAAKKEVAKAGAKRSAPKKAAAKRGTAKKGAAKKGRAR